MKRTEDYLKSRRVDPDQKIDMPNGGIKLKNLLEGFRIMVRHEALIDAKNAIKKLGK